MSKSSQKIWNSLEIAKLSVGVLTPVCIALLGISITQTAATKTAEREVAVRRETLQREAAALRSSQDRERLLRNSAEAREFATRQAAVRREIQQQDLAFRRERALAQENFNREVAYRSDVAASDLLQRTADAELEDRRRRNAFALSRFDYVLTKKREAWETISKPLERSARLVFTGRVLTNDERSSVQRDLKAIEEAYLTGRFYLGDVIDNFLDAVRTGIGNEARRDRPVDFKNPGEQFETLDNDYRNLMVSFHREITMGNTNPVRCADSDFDCQVRNLDRAPER